MLLSDWRRAKDSEVSKVIPEKKPGPSRPKRGIRGERAAAEGNEKMAAELARAKAALEVMGKRTRSWS